MKVTDAGQIARSNTAQNVQSGQTSGAFASALSAARSSGMDDLFRQASQQYNVPLNLLLAVGKAESNFNAGCVSKAGAQGVMQLMPSTAKHLGVSDAFDPEQNIFGGAKYLREMLDRYDGDIETALAAYNAGPGNVKKYGGIPPFKETQNYITRVLGYAGLDSGAQIEPPAAPAAPIVPAAPESPETATAPPAIEYSNGLTMPDSAGASLKEYILMQILSMQMDSGWSKKEE